MALPFEKIYKICEDKNMVPEMVWVRSRMGDNKGALFLIIDRLGDVSRAIDFAKERKDDELWEDLLRYSETRPTFIKALLENVTTEIDPIRIIRRIRNGLEIPGLKESIIKILQDFNLQISLMEGCGNVLESDCEGLARRLHRAQAGGQIGIPNGICLICSKPLLQVTQDLVLVFLCGHMVHAHCTSGGAGLPKQADSSLVGIGLGMERDFGIKLA
ncbi:Vacuolar protein sorting-associated protein 41 [Serendipita sp. 399]|nr:Vacuolar protein sorting-associated protein 41 [Serendipita sp. 399]